MQEISIWKQPTLRLAVDILTQKYCLPQTVSVLLQLQNISKINICLNMSKTSKTIKNKLLFIFVDI